MPPEQNKQTLSPLKLALCGYPVAHSLSPVIFRELGSHLNRSIEYDLIEIQDETQLRERLPDIQKHYHGINITTPLKTVMKGIVKRYEHFHAYNCVRFQSPSSMNADWCAPSDGICMIGTNTDYLSIKKVILDSQCRQDHAIIFGSGGAAQGALHALYCLGFKKITIIYRSDKTLIKNAATDIGVVDRCHFRQIDNLPTHLEANLFINATPLGLKGSDHPMIAYTQYFDVVFDMIYVPTHTPLIMSALKNNKTVVTGEKMLVWQALKSYEFWTESCLANPDTIHNLMLEKLSPLTTHSGKLQ